MFVLTRVLRPERASSTAEEGGTAASFYRNKTNGHTRGVRALYPYVRVKTDKHRRKVEFEKENSPRKLGTAPYLDKDLFGTVPRTGMTCNTRREMSQSRKSTCIKR